MNAINIIKSTCIPLPIHDVDTDQIIPSRFLKSVSMDSYADCLFADWRYKDEKLIEDFWLNKNFAGSILVTQSNFGCGSSREHAAWALKDYGISVVIAPSFADIFQNNALNNGLIPIIINPDLIDQTLKKIIHQPNFEIEMNLEAQTVNIPTIFNGQFEIDAFKKDCILNGYDEIDYLVQLKPEIEAFEQQLSTK